MDTEYVAMRRRMSRLRVKCGKGASLEAEDAKGDDPGFKGLIKYWKKHGIPIPAELLSDMADEKAKIAKARGHGRRRSRELEDLHMCASTGKFNLEKLSLDNVEEQDNDEEENDTSRNKLSSPAKKPLLRRQTDSHLKQGPGSPAVSNKSRGGSLKKTGSKGSVNAAVSSPSTNRKPMDKFVPSNK